MTFVALLFINRRAKQQSVLHVLLKPLVSVTTRQPALFLFLQEKLLTRVIKYGRAFEVYLFVTSSKLLSLFDSNSLLGVTLTSSRSTSTYEYVWLYFFTKLIGFFKLLLIFDNAK